MLSTTIIEYIENHTEWLIDKTAQFIQTPGMSGQEEEIAGVLVRCLEESGIKPFIDKAGNVVAEYTEDRQNPVPGMKKSLAFNVHLDTVPPGPASSWKHHPFGGITENGRVFGRGASDTKGAWAPIILAMEAVRNCGVRLEGRVMFTAVVMEELGLCAGMRILLESTLRDSLPDYIILGEPTGLGIALGHKGKTEMEITTHGRACHASAPWEGKNAIYRAGAVIAAMEKMAGEIGLESGDPLFGKTSLALTDIGCSPGVRNIIPDACTMAVDCRFPPGDTVDTVKTRVERYLRSNNIDADVRVSEEESKTYTGLPVKDRKLIPAFGLEESHILVREASRAVAETLGQSPSLYRWNFATDGGWSMGKLGIPTIGFSPCEESLAHTVDECVRIDYMVSAAKAYAAMIIRLLNGRQT
jgi:putative selenium metabolism hydrolase